MKTNEEILSYVESKIKFLEGINLFVQDKDERKIHDMLTATYGNLMVFILDSGEIDA